MPHIRSLVTPQLGMGDFSFLRPGELPILQRSANCLFIPTGFLYYVTRLVTCSNMGSYLW